MGMQGPGGEVGVPLNIEGVGDLSKEELEKRIAEAVRMPDELVQLFSYHQPTPQQEMAYRHIRATALQLAKAIHDNCPAGPDRTAAVRKIREAVMTANASIATNNAQYR